MHQSSGGRGNNNHNNNWQRFQQQQHQYYIITRRSSLTPMNPKVSIHLRANQSSLAAPPNALTINVVVQAICNHFHVNTFEDLMGISPLQLPILKQLHTVNQRVWTFVTCFIQSRRIHTLLECQEFFYNKKDFNRFTN
ncbi:unnamed protein product [Peronospora farinosa]|uniref:Uncharacterized protein n=1 Tax=Peronospora farinosa TaxID=134698 RepID=A0AAV0T244_9STRA|nr:unnamed protein product [Peronospora farinosa]